MAKKKGKKGKKGKKKGKKGKKNAEPEMTFKEAILAYQINIKEKQIDEYKYEIRGMEERNKRHKERNARLKDEQTYYIKHLLKQVREFENYTESEEVVEKEKVISVMREKWDTERREAKDIIELKESLKLMNGRIGDEEHDLSVWVEYKDKGRFEHDTQIQLLHQELADMQFAFDEMSTYLIRTLEKTKVDIEEETEGNLDRQKLIASERAVAGMDKYSKQAVMDNDWLKKEAEIHNRVYDSLTKRVEELERKNLEIMSELFDCKIDDLKISRNFFLTQFSDESDLDREPGILELDLSKLTTDGDEASITSQKLRKSPAKARPARPKSATQRAVEDKVFSLTDMLDNESESEDGGSEEGDDSDQDHTEDGSSTAMVSTAERDLDNYFSFDDEDFNAYLQLGPLELKLLNIKGQKMSLHEPLRPPTAEMKMKLSNPDKWPVTGSMIERVLHPDTRETIYKQ